VLSLSQHALSCELCKILPSATGSAQSQSLHKTKNQSKKVLTLLGFSYLGKSLATSEDGIVAIVTSSHGGRCLVTSQIFKILFCKKE